MRSVLRLFLLSILYCKSFGQAQQLRAYLDTKQFFAPGSGNYIEIYFQYVGYSLKYKSIEEGLQADVAVKLSISKDDSIVKSEAYLLQSPIMKDSIAEDFYDVKRYILEPGNYVLKVSLKDVISDGREISATQPIKVENLSKNVSFSDISVIEYGKKGGEGSPFFKSGYYMLPRLSNYYPEQLKSIPLYFEIYQSNAIGDSVLALKQSITEITKGIELSEFTVYTKMNASEIVPFMRNIDISKVPTGKYSLSYSVLSRNMKEICSTSYEFERSNDLNLPWTTETIILDPQFQASISNDSASYFLESLIPISNPAEVRNILTTLKKNDRDTERKHIQAFWSQTAPDNSYDAWIQYKGQVQLVEKLYANNFQEGFETDRGRVYLQYGAPTNIIARETSPTEYPYEIWQYNKIEKFSNKRFIFYNPDLVNNAYRLLHSDMIGELKNPSWQLTLSKRNTNNGTVDDPNANMMDHWGGESNNLFRQY